MFPFISVVLLLSLLTVSRTSQAQLSQVADKAEDICPLKVGSPIPSVSLSLPNGTIVDLRAEVSKKPTILVFYRGGWCVYCNRQMSQIKEIEHTLLDLGYQLIAISPDRPEKLRETLDQYKFNYTLLSDSKAIATQEFGLAFRVAEQTLQRYETINIDLEDASGETHHVLPVPAVFVVGLDGIIRYSYVNPNYRVRIDPDVLLAAAKAALK